MPHILLNTAFSKQVEGKITLRWCPRFLREPDHSFSTGVSAFCVCASVIHHLQSQSTSYYSLEKAEAKNCC